MQLNNIILSSKEKDSSAVYEVAFSYGLYQLDWDDLHRALLRKSSDGLIGKEGFASFFRERSDDGSEWNTTKQELEKRVMGIFDCFDRTGSDFCDVDELTCGLSLFIRGYVQLEPNFGGAPESNLCYLGSLSLLKSVMELTGRSLSCSFFSPLFSHLSMPVQIKIDQALSCFQFAR